MKNRVKAAKNTDVEPNDATVDPSRDSMYPKE